MGDTFAWGLVWGLVAGQLMTFGLLYLFMSHPRRDDSFEEEESQEEPVVGFYDPFLNDLYEYLKKHEGEEER